MATPGEIVTSTRGAEATERLAARVAAHLGPGDVVALSGDLGAGKTRFVAGACRALGYAGRVRSPSYTLLHIYRGVRPLLHFDLYRWELRGAELELEEWEELMEGPGVSFIEWAERLGTRCPERALRIRIDHAGEDLRRVRLVPAPGQMPELEGALAEAEGDPGR